MARGITIPAGWRRQQENDAAVDTLTAGQDHEQKQQATKKWNLGILSDPYTDEVPGSVILLSRAHQRNEPLGLRFAPARTSTSSLPSPYGTRPSSRTRNSEKKRTRDGKFILEPQPDDSANDPLNWPSLRRDVALLSLGFHCMVGGGMTPILAAGFNNVAETYNVTVPQVALTTGLYMLGLGIGSVFASPTAILWGKRPVYLVAIIVFLLSSVWCALSPTYPSLVVARIVQGLSISPVECLPSATVAEIFFLHERAYRLGIYTLLLLGGKNLIPLVSAAIIQSLGWRWVFWMVAIIAGFSFSLIFFFVPETFWDRAPRARGRNPSKHHSKPRGPSPSVPNAEEYHQTRGGTHAQDTSEVMSQSLAEQSEHISTPARVGFAEPPDTEIGQGNLKARNENISGNTDYSLAEKATGSTPMAIDSAQQSVRYTDYYREAPPRSYLESLRPWNGRLADDKWVHVMVRPFILLAYPAVLWSSMVYACAVGWLIVLSESVAHIYQNRDSYDFTSLQVGLVYISPFVGGVLGTAVAGKISDLIVRFMARRNDGVYEPEFRLVMALPIALSTTIGLMGFGWSAAEKDSWIVPTVFFGVISFGCCLASTTAVTFVVDSYRIYAGEALVTLNFCKNILHGFIFSLFFTRWLESSGPKDVFLAVGGIQMGCLLLSIPMYVYGKRARMWTVRKNFMENF